MKHIIKQFAKEKNISLGELAEKVGISRQALNDIILRGSPKTKVVTCMNIKRITGLEPWEYLNGLEVLKSLSSGSQKPTTTAQRAEATQD
jgi:DNA-binding XRE family transcriptional regulator